VITDRTPAQGRIPVWHHREPAALPLSEGSVRGRWGGEQAVPVDRRATAWSEPKRFPTSVFTEDLTAARAHARARPLAAHGAGKDQLPPKEPIRTIRIDSRAPISLKDRGFAKRRWSYRLMTQQVGAIPVRREALRPVCGRQRRCLPHCLRAWNLRNLPAPCIRHRGCRVRPHRRLAADLRGGVLARQATPCAPGRSVSAAAKPPFPVRRRHLRFC
jgi:hypothetical protein